MSERRPQGGPGGLAPKGMKAMTLPPEGFTANRVKMHGSGWSGWGHELTHDACGWSIARRYAGDATEVAWAHGAGCAPQPYRCSQEPHPGVEFYGVEGGCAECGYRPSPETTHLADQGARPMDSSPEFDWPGDDEPDLAPTPPRDVLVKVLVYHWRKDNGGGCGCGWDVLGASWPEHVADIYEESIAARADGRTTT